MTLLDDPLPWLDAMAAMDERTLGALTRAAGRPWDAAEHRAQLEASLPDARFLGVARGPSLLAYVLLRPMPGTGGHDWFAGMINSEPSHRDAAVWRRLFAAVAALLRREGVQRLHSHVYKTNAPSLTLHRRLGFERVQENERAVAFRVTVASLLSHPLARPASVV